MTQMEVAQRHTEAIITAIERQRNEALSREVQKDALVTLLQDQLRQMRTTLTQRDAEVAHRDGVIDELKQKLAEAIARADQSSIFGTGGGGAASEIVTSGGGGGGIDPAPETA